MIFAFTKRLFLLVFLNLFFGGFEVVACSTDSIGVSTDKEGAFIRHQVDKGDTWYSIARRYGITYSELKMANDGAPAMLKSGQVLSVPLPAKPTDPRRQKNTMNEEQVKSPASETDKHVVKDGETVYSISKRYGIRSEDLLSCNDLSPNASITVGQTLVVKKTSVRTSVNEETKKGTDTKKAPSTKPVKAESGTTEKELSTPLSGYVFSGGKKQVSEKGIATFIAEEETSTNKYYALHRSASIGTVIKVTNRLNGKSVFVKVVGVLPELKENEGTLIKLSKAAAHQLGSKEQQFAVELLYGVSGK